MLLNTRHVPSQALLYAGFPGALMIQDKFLQLRRVSNWLAPASPVHSARRQSGMAPGGRRRASMSGSDAARAVDFELFHPFEQAICSRLPLGIQHQDVPEIGQAADFASPGHGGKIEHRA